MAAPPVVDAPAAGVAFAASAVDDGASAIAVAFEGVYVVAAAALADVAPADAPTDAPAPAALAVA